MTYFGGLGAGKGWLKFQFLIEPEILREILVATKAVLVITNTRVPADYGSTPLPEYMSAYASYLKAMLESPEAAARASGLVAMGLTTSLDHFKPAPCRDARFKLMNPQEPVINLSPETISYDAQRGQLCTNVMTDLYFGMELSYPRVISSDREQHEILHDTAQFPGQALFQDLKSRIQKITRPCQIKSPAREHRTSIRITEGMRESMRSHPGLKAANLIII